MQIKTLLPVLQMLFCPIGILAQLGLEFGILVIGLVVLHVVGFLALKYNDSFPKAMP